jgi:hypothetical protein
MIKHRVGTGLALWVRHTLWNMLLCLGGTACAAGAVFLPQGQVDTRWAR